jgi:hypothetical protein
MAAVRLDPKTKQLLDALSKRDGRPADTVVSEALKLYFGKHKETRDPLPTKRGRPKRKEIPDESNKRNSIQSGHEEQA